MDRTKENSPIITTLIENLIELIEKGNAHIPLDAALENLPFSLLGKRPQNVPYSIWQLSEHIRIAQWDILEFSKSARHISPKWPEDYWPKEVEPSSENEWNDCVKQIKEDRKAFINLLKNAGETLAKPFEHGEGQSLLKEALVIADHNSYHTGEIIIVRRLLNAWK
jgi:hypothetical protein